MSTCSKCKHELSEHYDLESGYYYCRVKIKDKTGRGIHDKSIEICDCEHIVESRILKGLYPFRRLEGQTMKSFANDKREYDEFYSNIHTSLENFIKPKSNSDYGRIKSAKR